MEQSGNLKIVTAASNCSIAYICLLKCYFPLQLLQCPQSRAARFDGTGQWEQVLPRSKVGYVRARANLVCWGLHSETTETQLSQARHGAVLRSKAENSASVTTSHWVSTMRCGRYLSLYLRHFCERLGRGSQFVFYSEGTKLPNSFQWGVPRAFPTPPLLIFHLLVWARFSDSLRVNGEVWQVTINKVHIEKWAQGLKLKYLLLPTECKRSIMWCVQPCTSSLLPVRIPSFLWEIP